MTGNQNVTLRVACVALLAAGMAFSAGCRGPKGDPGASGGACTVKDNGDGTETIACADGSSVTVHDGANGSAASCSVQKNADGTATLSCTDGTSVTISNGTNGTNGGTCSVKDNGNGTKTITCPDGSSVTVTNGTSCSVTATDGGSSTITCADGTSVNVSNGTNGVDGASCSVKDNGDGTKTISCTNGTSVTVADGTSCSVVANSNGTKTVSCTDGTAVTIAPPIGTVLDAYTALPGVVLHIANITGAGNGDGTFAPGDLVSVKFSITTNAGIPLDLSELDGAEIWIAGPTTNYQHILPTARDQQSFTDVATASHLNSDGSYTYTFAAPLPANYGVPLWNTAKFSLGELTGPLQAGTYTVAMQAHRNYTVAETTYPDVGADTLDFLFGHATTLEAREVVTTANCNGCHASLRAHDGLYRNTTLCATCHTAGAEDANSTDTNDATPVTIELRSLIHKLHNGPHLPSVNGVTTNPDGSRNYASTKTPFVVGGVTAENFSAVQFPVLPSFQIAMPRNSGFSKLTSAQQTADNAIRQGVIACFRCHGTGSSSFPVKAPAQGDYFTQPSRMACGSCHDDVDFTKPYVKNGQRMPPQANDDGCIYCHRGFDQTLDVRGAHTHPLNNSAFTPSVNFNISALTGGTGPNGAFKSGDEPTLSFSITDGAANNIPITSLDSITSMVVGPTSNRQVPFPYATTSNIWLSPYDFAGRVASGTTTNKGIMSRVVPIGATVTEPLVVQFTSATAFTVTGHQTGPLGGAALAAPISSNPTGSSIASIYLTADAVPQTISVTFNDSTSYTVAGSVSGSMGSGLLPNTVSATSWFTSNDGTISFSVTVGTTPFVGGNKIYVTVFKGAVANPVLFAVAAGRAAFVANDRIYYNYTAPAPTYSLNVPMDLPFEYLGDGNGNAGQVLTAANTPVWYSYQSLYERTALGGISTTLTAAVAFEGAFLPVASVGSPTPFATSDYLVIDDGLSSAEYVQVGLVDSAANRVWPTTPLRFTHSSGASVKKVTLTFRQEGVDYTLNSGTGTITLTAGSTNSFVMSYRTNGRFGWYRKPGDTLQAVYAPPPHNNPNLDETWGNWAGKSYASGTYTAAIWGYQIVPYASAGEYQAYRATAVSAKQDFLFGSATTLTPYALIDTTNNCQSCHEDLSFHSGSRRDASTCLLCHGVAGLSLSSYNAMPPPAGTTVSSETGNFRTLIHNLHADTFPVTPNGAGSCATCHGTSTVWQAPTNRNHPTQQVMPVRTWRAACSGCHTSTAAGAHFDAMAPNNVESCSVCHAAGAVEEVSLVHKAR